MASWHRRARIGVAIFGLAFAGIVYSAMGERRVPGPRLPVPRIDEKALYETTGGILQRVLGIERQFEVQADLRQSYPDGSTKYTGVRRIAVRRGDKEFVVSAREARSGPGNKELEATGEVRLRASDGFELATERATYNMDEGVAKTPDAVTFSKGRMSGSGVGITYDENTEVLTIAQQAQIVTRDDEGNTTVELNAAAATLDRLQDLLLLNDGVHVLRGEQVIDARDAVAQLSPDEDVIRFVKLFGDSRVAGAGSTIEAMSARDIDLDYTDDGATLERVAMRGGSAIAMTGRNGAAGRHIHGDSLDLGLAADGSLLTAVGKGKVQLDLPAADTTPARSIRAAALDARGKEGRGLTDATFTRDVSFTEGARGGVTSRSARSQTLNVSLANDAVTSATFTGSASFEEQGLTASAARVEYQPEKGTLSLSGTEAGRGPCVADEQVTIDAQVIEVALQGHRMSATGKVNTTLRGQSAARGIVACGRTLALGASRAANNEPATRLPGLLQEGANVSVTADALDYQGASGKVVFTGTEQAKAALIQGTTSIRAVSLTIDQASGDLIATGSALSTIALDGEESLGVAHELRYVDATRLITYSPAPPVPAAAPTALRESELRSPHGDLKAARIEIVLAKEESRVERIQADRNVSLTLDKGPLKLTRVTGAARLDYDADDERYVFTATPLAPLTWFERDGQDCRDNTGTALTIYKSISEASLDGKGDRRTQTIGSACAPAPR